MEFEDDTGSSMEDSCSEKDVENELYSILHFGDFSQGIPDSIKQKYDIRYDDNDQISISLKPKESEEPEDCSTVNEIIFIPLDKSGSDSCQNVVKNVRPSQKHTLRKLDELQRVDLKGLKRKKIPVITISDDSDSEIDIMINTQVENVTYVSDSSSDGWHKNSKPYNWKDVECPTSWTRSMKKYYNKPSERLRNFDHDAIIKKFKGTKGNWEVNFKDFDLRNRSRPACSICKMRGHLRSECPKRTKTCHMCGYPGHMEHFCPDRMCLNCGNKSSAYRSVCEKCIDGTRSFCSICKKEGHIEELCSELWRKFHSTTDSNDSARKEPISKEQGKGRKVCCNCAQEGHVYENCRKLFTARKPKPIPAPRVSRDNDGANTEVLRVFIPTTVNLEEAKFRKLFQKFERKGLAIRRISTSKVILLKVEGCMTVSCRFRQSLLRLANLATWKNKRKGKKKNFSGVR